MACLTQSSRPFSICSPCLLLHSLRSRRTCLAPITCTSTCPGALSICPSVHLAQMPPPLTLQPDCISCLSRNLAPCSGSSFPPRVGAETTGPRAQHTQVLSMLMGRDGHRRAVALTVGVTVMLLSVHSPQSVEATTGEGQGSSSPKSFPSPPATMCVHMSTLMHTGAHAVHTQACTHNYMCTWVCTRSHTHTGMCANTHSCDTAVSSGSKEDPSFTASVKASDTLMASSDHPGHGVKTQPARRLLPPLLASGSDLCSHLGLLGAVRVSVCVCGWAISAAVDWGLCGLPDATSRVFAPALP